MTIRSTYEGVYKWHIRIVGPETRDPSCGWDPRNKTWNPGTKGGIRDPRSWTQLIGGTRDPRPGTLKVGPETRDPIDGTQGPRPENRDIYFTWNLRPETQNTECGNWDTYDRWDTRPKTNISCWTWDARTMIQMNLIKCPINKTWDHF